MPVSISTVPESTMRSLTWRRLRRVVPAEERDEDLRVRWNRAPWATGAASANRSNAEAIRIIGRYMRVACYAGCGFLNSASVSGFRRTQNA